MSEDFQQFFAMEQYSQELSYLNLSSASMSHIARRGQNFHRFHEDPFFEQKDAHMGRYYDNGFDFKYLTGQQSQPRSQPVDTDILFQSLNSADMWARLNHQQLVEIAPVEPNSVSVGQNNQSDGPSNIDPSRTVHNNHQSDEEEEEQRPRTKSSKKDYGKNGVQMGLKKISLDIDSSKYARAMLRKSFDEPQEFERFKVWMTLQLRVYSMNIKQFVETSLMPLKQDDQRAMYYKEVFHGYLKNFFKRRVQKYLWNDKKNLPLLGITTIMTRLRNFLAYVDQRIEQAKKKTSFIISESRAILPQDL